MDPNIKQSIVDRLKQTNNVLVTVKSNPTVDQLVACIGLTLFLNKQGKHATAVFSGAVPSIIEFLKPESTLEKDTNSLRDFIIALDKSKADKLRYKVEDKVVRIFITPYKTSLSQDDLEFSQGDFNVDVVIALGVHVREELDQAIMSHGRILHDATVVSINNSKPADLGALNWNDSKASSLSEMTASLVDLLQPNALDAQIATAFLTGIVAETERFSNAKTTSITMNLSAKLMAAGANQQLVATKLQEPAKIADPTPPAQKTNQDGELEIEHPAKQQDIELPLPASDGNIDGEIQIDDQGNLKLGLQDKKAKAEAINNAPKKPSRLALDPPTLGGALTANTQPNQLEPSVDPLSGKSPNDAILTREEPASIDFVEEPNTPTASNINQSQTLSAIEQTVASPHVTGNLHENGLKPIDSNQSPANLSDILREQSSDDAGATMSVPASLPPDQGIDYARKAVEEASFSSPNSQLEPTQSLNSQILGENLNGNQSFNNSVTTQNNPNPLATTNLPPNLVPPNSPLPQEQTGINQVPSPPPSVPPPMMPPNFNQLPSQDNNDFNAPL